jgi:NAD(P)-dependent dehydrogenase (short-subunit alcohol dehydrogenase family)
LFQLTSKITVITGAASGIGAATVARFAAAGAHVVGVDLRKPEHTQAEHFIEADIRDTAAIAGAFDFAIEHYGRLDVAINNAGIAQLVALEQTKPDEVDRLWQVNARGVLFGIKEAAARMKPGGAIVNTASLSAFRAAPSNIPYSMTKAAVVAATQGAALELGPRNIRVNCVCPGTIVTPMTTAVAPDLVNTLTRTLAPLGRPGTADEIAAIIHFLASDDASYITGQAIIADGGWSVGTSIATVECILETSSRV